MLDEQDLVNIGTLLDTKLDHRFGTFEKKLDTKLDQRFAVFEEKLDVKLDTKFAEQEKRIIHAVGEILEHNVFPQFAEIHSELRKLKIVAGWQT